MKQETQKALIIALVIAVIIGFAVLGLTVGIYLGKKGSVQTAENSIAEQTTAVLQTDGTTLPETTAAETESSALPMTETYAKEESAATTAAPQTETAPKAVQQETEAPAHQEIPEEPASPEPPAFDYAAEFRAIVNKEGSPMNTGYYTDVNGDGINELILKNPADMNFHMYTYDGEIHDTYFGLYKSMNEAKLFRVPAENGQYYFYWRCEYMLFSIQGYYDPFTNSEIDIGVNYNFDDHAEWILFFNNNEYASGREEGGSTYGATPNCYQKLLDMFRDYGFQIYDNSDYIKLECMDQAALLNAIH